MIKMKGTSTYNVDLINTRIDQLRAKGTQENEADEAERQRELQYLVDLKRREFGDITEPQ